MISCGGSSSGKTGTIVSPKSGSQDQGKFSTKSVQQDQGLVSSMWDSFTYKKLDATKKTMKLLAEPLVIPVDLPKLTSRKKQGQRSPIGGSA